ncbi:shikimate kinase [Desulforamulus reducens MI-1]|uniref:Shikimate kinase n=1 Tax=Desulforamulus reducens (strain ATCC BAA-1160 / DSM 100696 / MI-1) TaxID=349161 RepID=A4J3A2_DESRM|nr:shikimate kinase [Desulforamulus reducens]ABO49555.1 shikimate kinase [Desulforamulus reducens MI-1]
MKNIVLVGFMGSGKSSIGHRLARKLGYQFVDTDYAIEEVTGLTVEQIFAKHGIKRFRGEEVLLVSKLADKEGVVIATGGGLVLNSQNVEKLQQNGIFICLQASPETICKRVKNKRTRPLLARGNLKEKVIKLLQERKDAYDMADLTISTDHLEPDDIVKIIYKFLLERGVIHGNHSG